MDEIERNETWMLVDLPVSSDAIGVKNKSLILLIRPLKCLIFKLGLHTDRKGEGENFDQMSFI